MQHKKTVQNVGLQDNFALSYICTLHIPKKYTKYSYYKNEKVHSKVIFEV